MTPGPVLAQSYVRGGAKVVGLCRWEQMKTTVKGETEDLRLAMEELDQSHAAERDALTRQLQTTHAQLKEVQHEGQQLHTQLSKLQTRQATSDVQLRKQRTAAQALAVVYMRQLRLLRRCHLCAQSQQQQQQYELQEAKEQLHGLESTIKQQVQKQQQQQQQLQQHQLSRDKLSKLLAHSEAQRQQVCTERETLLAKLAKLESLQHQYQRDAMHAKNEMAMLLHLIEQLKSQLTSQLHLAQEHQQHLLQLLQAARHRLLELESSFGRLLISDSSREQGLLLQELYCKRQAQATLTQRMSVATAPHPMQHVDKCTQRLSFTAHSNSLPEHEGAECNAVVSHSCSTSTLVMANFGGYWKSMPRPHSSGPRQGGGQQLKQMLYNTSHLGKQQLPSSSSSLVPLVQSQALKRVATKIRTNSYTNINIAGPSITPLHTGPPTMESNQIGLVQRLDR